MDPVPGSVSTGAEDLRFLNTLEGELETLHARIRLADVALYTGQDKTGPQKFNEEWARRLLVPRLGDWIAEATGRTSSSSLLRRLELLRRMLIDCKLEQSGPLPRLRGELQRVFAGQDGEGADLDSKAMGLVRARAERAHDQGFDSYVETRLSLEGLSLPRWEELFEGLAREARDHVRSVRGTFREATKVDEWRPWDPRFMRYVGVPNASGHFRGEDAVGAAASGTKGWGFPEEAYRFKTHIAQTPFAGMVMVARGPGDIHLIANPRAGWTHHKILLHETGHAIHAALLGGETFLLRNTDFLPSFGGFMEGIGTMFERIASDRAWLDKVDGLAVDVRAEIRARAEDRFWFDLGWNLVRTGTELQAYLDPQKDPHEIRDRLDREIMGYDTPSPHPWADALLVEAPLYGKSHVLGTVFSTQVLRSGLREVGGELWPNPRLGPWLREKWFAPGAAHDWIPRVAEVTAQPLSVRELSWS